MSLELHIPHYRVRMSGFIKRCWKCVINFGLQWSLQNIAKLKSSIEHVLSVHCNKRGAENVKARKNTKVFWLILSTKIENIWKQYLTKNLNHQHFVHLHISSSFTSQRNPKASWGFPTNILLRGHGRHRPAHPRPPSPRGAVGPRNRGLCRLPSAAVFRLGSRGPSSSHWQNPTEGSGEKFWENFGRLKSRSLGNFGHSKILPKRQEHCGFEEVLMTSSWLKKAMWTRLAVKMLWGNFKNVPSLRKQICVRLGHNRIWNQSPTVGISCKRVRGLTRIWTGKT